MAKRLIDANAYAYPGDLINEPTVDAVEVVRCRDCKYWDDHSICEVHSGWPDQYNTGHSDYTEPDDFCSYGERKEERLS